MTTFILHGGYTGEKNELNESFFKELALCIPTGGNVLLVYFASTSGVAQKYEEDKKRIGSFINNRDVQFVLADVDNFREQLLEADVIYIRGGDTSKLKKDIEQTPDFCDLIRGKVVSGSSAGAYVLSTYYFSNSTNKVWSGLGCLPIRCACHFESTKHGEAVGKDPIAALNEYDNSLELVLLRDSEWRVFQV
jgi:peptidase E